MLIKTCEWKDFLWLVQLKKNSADWSKYAHRKKNNIVLPFLFVLSLDRTCNSFTWRSPAAGLLIKGRTPWIGRFFGSLIGPGLQKPIPTEHELFHIYMALYIFSCLEKEFFWLVHFLLKRLLLDHQSMLLQQPIPWVNELFQLYMALCIYSIYSCHEKEFFWLVYFLVC